MKKLIAVMSLGILLTGCANENLQVNKDTFLSDMNSIVEKTDTIFNSIDIVKDGDLLIEASTEVDYTNEANYEKSVEYLKNNSQAMTDDMNKKYTEYLKQINVYEHLTEYEKRLLNTDLNKLKEDLHNSFSSKSEEFTNISATLVEEKTKIEEANAENNRLIGEFKVLRNDTIHLIHEKTNSINEGTLTNILNEKNNLLNAIGKLDGTKGKISDILDSKRALVKQQSYSDLGSNYNNILSLVNERNNYLKEMIEITKRIINILG